MWFPNGTDLGFAIGSTLNQRLQLFVVSILPDKFTPSLRNYDFGLRQKRFAKTAFVVKNHFSHFTRKRSYGHSKYTIELRPGGESQFRLLATERNMFNIYSAERLAGIERPGARPCRLKIRFVNAFVDRLPKSKIT